MTSTQVCRQLMASFLRMVNKYKAMEKFTTSYGTEAVFYHSERHMLDVMRDHPELNITDLARQMGVTKGAISQVVAKLEQKGAVERYKGTEDDKQVLVRLTQLGQIITTHHHEVNERTVQELSTFIEDRSHDQVEFLCDVFEWIEQHLDEELKHMKAEHGR